MNSKSDKVKIIIGNKADDIIKELFESFKKRCEEGLEKKIEGSQFVSESVDLLYYILHRISLNRDGSYVDSPEWLKNKRATIIPKNKDSECFKYAIAVALNHEIVKKSLKEFQKLSFLLINIIGRG